MNASLGQKGDVPVHVSATSQKPVESRHTVVADSNSSVGQPTARQPKRGSSIIHTHISATSQDPAEDLQTLPISDGERQLPIPAVAVCVGITEVRVPINAISAISNVSFFAFTTLEKNILHNTSYVPVCLDYQLQLYFM